MPEVIQPQMNPSPTTPPDTSTSQPVQPGTPMSSIPTPPTPPIVSSMSTGSGGSKKRFMLAAGAIVVALLAIGGGYVFGFYLPNTPDNVYSASLANSGKALDNLVDYSRQQQQANYKGATFNGTFKVKSSSGSFDVKLNGSAEKNGNATVQLSGDILGEKASANVRSVKVDSNQTPDIYLQFTGIKPLLDTEGLSQFDTLDGQWIVVDHTLIDTYAKNFQQELGGSSSSSASDATTAPTYAQVQDAIAKVQAVNRQYIFTTDTSKAVLANQKFISQDADEGRTLNHYKVGYNKDHLTAYAKALAQALDSSQLNDWSKKMNGGKNLSDTMDFKSLEDDIKNAKSDYTFDLWADTKTKLISKLTFAGPSDASSTFTIRQGYTGGSAYPFSVDFADKDSSGNPEKGTIGLNLDTKTNKVALNFSVDTKQNSTTSTISADFTITPSNNAVTVTAPSGAKSIIDVLRQLGLGDPTTMNGLSSL